MNKVILITGGSDGLGREIAKELQRDNTVIILSRNEKKLKETAKEIICDYYVCDICNEKRLEEVVEDIIATRGKIDIVINSAGVYAKGELTSNTYEQIDELTNINLAGTIKVCKAALPFMKMKHSGQFILINSNLGQNTIPERAIYTASKWGVTGFAKGLQDEVERCGIKITSVFPNSLKTNIAQNNGYENSKNERLDPAEVAKLIRFIIELPKEVCVPEVSIKLFK